MKKILLTNDDGFDSNGLLALKEALSDIAQVLIVAPAREKSACGHGLCLTKPLKFIKVDDDFYKLDDGGPTDCVYLALNAIYKDGKKPDLVISGINLGSNMGEDTTYSGTLAGAMEGVIQGVPSIAISQVMRDKNLSSEFDFALAKKVIRELVEKIFNNSFPLGDRKLLNVNVPQISIEQFKGYKITQKGYRLYTNNAHLNRDPRGNEYYWLGLQPLAWRERGGVSSDFAATKEGYVSITPITLNLTSYEDIAMLEGWLGE
ncbi:5'/3'-nucleotidase SurE [Helicobacter anatolicus]|uniref:5'/3'-nucleotidase SurE n=1 Tax=Helicobacter anatolicus TaxID=2905874 RepID=UPI001E5EBFA5|nr:5'/3'-nucleotidase SurE [Helicobacter anatolicus]MCE3039347.1 5'/3'-nucleotidase SurE [Helicobacter anatolicus]